MSAPPPYPNAGPSQPGDPTPYPPEKSGAPGMPPPGGDPNAPPPVAQPPPAYGAPPPGAPQYGAPPPGQPQYGAPPPGQPVQPGYPAGGPPPGPGGPTTVVVTQPVVQTTLVQQFRGAPVQTVCPHCRAQIVTALTFDTGTMTWVVCAVICLVGCDLGCCFIPFCLDSCKDVVHTCPNCRQQISRWNRL